MLEFCGWSPLVSDELLQRHVYWLSAQMKWFALSVSQHQASGSRFTLPSKPLLGPQEGGSSVQSFVSVLFFFGGGRVVVLSLITLLFTSVTQKHLNL